MKKFAMVGLLALAACSSEPGVAPAAKTDSATARTVLVPVRGVKLRVQSDLAAEPVAILTYAEDTVSIDKLLFLRRDVFPAVQQATGCRVAVQAPDNQLLPASGRTRIPLAC